jgi:hypothetical protein
MTPAEIIARELASIQYSGLRDRDIEPAALDILTALHTAGIRLIPAGEYDPVTIEVAVKVITKHNKTGREWMPGSLWDTITNEAASRIPPPGGEGMSRGGG